MRLAIVGTRILACPGDKQRVTVRILQVLDRSHPDVVITGGASGVDTLAEYAAIMKGYTEENGRLIVHRPARRSFHGIGGYRHRDGLIAADCTHLLRLACRKATTYGSGWTADEAERLRKEVTREWACAPISPTAAGRLPSLPSPRMPSP